MSRFFTYLWLREDGTPYYAGKGTRLRALRKGGPTDSENIILQEWPDEQSAFDGEKLLIAVYGRKDLGTGILINHTNGGDGASRAPKKQCPVCRTGDVMAFGKNAKRWDGLQIYCRTCRSTLETVHFSRRKVGGRGRPRRGIKCCPGCGTADVSAFGPNRARPDGLQVYCKICTHACQSSTWSRSQHRRLKVQKLTNESISVGEFLDTRGRE